MLHPFSKAALLPALIAVTLAGCAPRPGDSVTRRGDEIVAAGELFHTGTRVVLWLEPQGYDAYRAHRHFNPSETMPANPVARNNPNRYGSRRNLPADLRERVDREGWTLDNLREQVDQFVYHYDVCGTSARCFYILHDARGLSVHFMLDIDGTIYQTLDLAERAWHAGTANDRSIGIEIAQIGAYAKLEGTLEQWYAIDEATGWPVITLPASIATNYPVRTPGFVGRPARREPVRGLIHGREYVQYDYTNEQYDALIKLTAALCRIFPKLQPDAPRDENGDIIHRELTREEMRNFSGLIGHYHVTRGKTDPGPAFDWDRVITGTQRELRYRHWPRLALR